MPEGERYRLRVGNLLAAMGGGDQPGRQPLLPAGAGLGVSLRGEPGLHDGLSQLFRYRPG